MSEKRILAVINCTSAKNEPEPGSTIEAQEMYSASPTFIVQRDFVDHVYDNWCILSAGYGLVSPTKQIKMYDACLHKTKSDNGRLITEEEKTQIKQQVSKVLDKMLEQFELIHFHVGNDYWDAFVGTKYQNHPKIVRIKKQQNQPNTRHVYREGLEKYKQGESLPEVLEYLNTIRVANPERESEQSGWWYHPIEKPFYGKSNELGKEYGVNDGNLFMHYHQDTVQSKHVMGWTNVLDNLRLLKQTDKGQWRLRSQNDEQFVTEERIQEIEQYVLENQPKTKLTNEEKFDVLFDDSTPTTKPSSLSSSTFISKHDLQSVI